MHYLTIDGEDHPIKYTFSKILALSAMHKVNYIRDVEKIIQEMSLGNIPQIILLGLEGALEFEGKKSEWTIDKVNAALDKDQQLLGRALAAINENLTYAFAVPSDEAENGEALAEGVGKTSDGVKFKK